MNDLSLEIRQAVVAHLRASAGVTALVPAARIYGERAASAQGEPQWPFIRMGYANSDMFEATGWDGVETQFTVHVFADGPHTDAVQTIAKRVVTAMENFAPGNMGGASADWVRTVTVPDDIPEKLHAIVTFRIFGYSIAS